MKRLTLLLSLGLALTTWTNTHAAADQLVYIGTYTGGTSPSKGIYAYALDSKTGKLEEKGLAVETGRPSFLAIHPSKKYLYSVAELGPKEGGISSYAIDQATGKLTLINQQPSHGNGPCHVNVDATGKVLLAANYGSGNVVSYPIKEDGSIGEAVSIIQQGPGSMVNERRQKGPHAHSFYTDAQNRFAISCDLGSDKLFVYKLDTEAASLTPNDPASVATPPGGGPRHFAFHPNGKFGYTNNELTMAVSALSYDAEKGAFEVLQTLSTLPEGTESSDKFSTAETQVHPSGKFVYVSNRGHNSIAIYTVDEQTGKLTFVEAAPSIVEIPRNFGIDPTGKWLIAGGQDSHNLAVFSIDQETGKITPTGDIYEVGSPVCVKFLTLE